MKLTYFSHYRFGAPLLFLLLAVGCSASTSPTGTTTTEGSMVAMVNGYEWSSSVIPPGISGGGSATMNSSGALTMTGVSNAHGSLVLMLLHPHLGADTLGIGNSGSYITDDKHVYLTAGPNQGTVQLTTFDTVHHLVSGTFSFSAARVDSVSSPAMSQITNGSFYNLEWKAN
jgi:hypothetical protein